MGLILNKKRPWKMFFSNEFSKKEGTRKVPLFWNLQKKEGDIIETARISRGKEV